jgi:hypothetical protein
MKCILLVVWETICHWLYNFLDSAPPIYTLWELKCPLHLVIPVLEKRCVATCKKVLVTLREKVNVQLEVITTENMLTQSEKVKKFTHCRFLLKQFDYFLCIVL